MLKSDSDKVKEFTEASLNINCPKEPILIPKDEIIFTIRMIFSEASELVSTVTSNSEECKELLNDALNNIDLCKKYDYKDDIERIAAQADAMVDANYYMQNIACKHGMNLSKIFDIVHDANMNKRDPITYQFIRRESDGKIMKPLNWKAPDIETEIKRQKEKGAFM